MSREQLQAEMDMALANMEDLEELRSGFLGQTGVHIGMAVLTVVGVNLGIFISTFARNEFQVVQFIPLVLAPQIFLAGVILPVEDLPWYLKAIARVLPMTYAVEALQDIMLRGHGLGDVARELAVLAGFAVALLALAAATVRRT